MALYKLLKNSKLRTLILSSLPITLLALLWQLRTSHSNQPAFYPYRNYPYRNSTHSKTLLGFRVEAWTSKDIADFFWLFSSLCPKAARIAAVYISCPKLNILALWLTAYWIIQATDCYWLLVLTEVFGKLKYNLNRSACELGEELNPDFKDKTLQKCALFNFQIYSFYRNINN